MTAEAEFVRQFTTAMGGLPPAHVVAATLSDEDNQAFQKLAALVGAPDIGALAADWYRDVCRR